MGVCLLLMSISEHPLARPGVYTTIFTRLRSITHCQRATLFPLAENALPERFYLLSFNHCAVFSLSTYRHGRPRLSHQCEPPIVRLCLLCEREPVDDGLPALLQVELLKQFTCARKPLAHCGLTQPKHSRDLVRGQPADN